MLKKTLHSAVAAIAVSTIFLPAAVAAKEDLVLKAQGSKWYTVATRSMVRDYSVNGQRGELVPVSYHSGTVKFDKKVSELGYINPLIETHWSSRQAGEWMTGGHVLCEPGTAEYKAFESTVLFRGSAKKNSLTMDTVSATDSMDPNNESASVTCFNSAGYATSSHWTYLISGATGEWSCAYTEGEAGWYGSEDYYSNDPADAVLRPFRADLSFDQKIEATSQGAIIIPRPCE